MCPLTAERPEQHFKAKRHSEKFIKSKRHDYSCLDMSSGTQESDGIPVPNRSLRRYVHLLGVLKNHGFGVLDISPE